MNKSLKESFNKLNKLRQQAELLGIFTGERDILECKYYNLKEDVTFKGFLITYFGEKLDEDTGLRFIETKDEKVFICPNCENKII